MKLAASDLGQRLSDSCVRTTLAVLALCAFAYGVAEKVDTASRFNGYYAFLSARATLDSLLTDLQNDRCWQSFAQTLPGSRLANSTTLAELKRIECTIHHDKMRVNPSRGVGPSAIGPGRIAFVTPANDASARDGWYPLGAAETLEHAIVPLWDDALLTRGELYSSVAEDDIYRWELRRFRVAQQRDLPLIPERLKGNGDISESNFLRLQVQDLIALDLVVHSPLGELDRRLSDFRSPLPNSSMDVDLGLAAQAIAFAIALFMAVLAGYIRIVGAQQLFSHPGTIFEALFGSRFTELVSYFVVVLPLAALYTLGSSIGWVTQTGIVVAVCGAAVAWATFVILRRLRPHSKLAGRRKF